MLRSINCALAFSTPAGGFSPLPSKPSAPPSEPVRSTVTFTGTMSRMNAAPGPLASRTLRSGSASALPKGTLYTPMRSAFRRRTRLGGIASVERPSESTTIPEIGRAAAFAKARSIALPRSLRRPVGGGRLTGGAPAPGPLLGTSSCVPLSKPVHAITRWAPMAVKRSRF